MKALILAIACLAPNMALGANASELTFRANAKAHMRTELAAGHVADLGLKALDTLMGKAHGKLRAEGYAETAYELEGEWVIHRKEFMASYDMGDHAPAVQWIADWYAKVEEKLGVQICEMLHLRDVFVIDYGWPVVTHPDFDTVWCAQTIEDQPEDTCKAEHRRHAAGTKYQREDDPYADPVQHFGVYGVAAYWVSLAACEAALWGSDGTFLCGTAATAVEIGVTRFIAPPVADKIWDKRNPE